MSEAGDGFLTAERVMDWAESARPGETLTYASGDHAPAEALAAARRLADAELVDLVGKRRDGKWIYIAQRRSRAFDAGRIDYRPSRGAVRPSEKSRARAVDRALLRLLSRTARLGLVCPGNAALAVMLGLSGALAASYRMRRLVAAGVIAVEHADPTRPRIVTILATGARTAEAGHG